MIHGYHVILPAYGFWLPNDPRGSWSDFVGRWELLRFGRSTKSFSRRELQELSEDELRLREAAQQSLKYPAVQFTGEQALQIAQGFADQSAKSNYTIWACAILPEHTHLVIARHTYKVEQIANLLKGAAHGKSSTPICTRSLHSPNLVSDRHECGASISGRFISTASMRSKMRLRTSTTTR